MALDRTYPDSTFLVGVVGALPLEPASASKIACNAALVIVPLERDSCSPVRDGWGRPSRCHDLVGEIPEVNGFERYGIYRGNSMLAFLWHLLRYNGLRTFLGMIRRSGKAIFGKEQIILNSAGIFFATPQHMIAIAEECGLKLQSYFRHKHVNEAAIVSHSDCRYDYIFSV